MLKDFWKSGMSVYRTPQLQTMQRPVHEPPEIDMIDVFEFADNIDFLKDAKQAIPDPAVRCDYLDVWTEHHALVEYLNWVQDARTAATLCKNEEKYAFYSGLSSTLAEEYQTVCREYRRMDMKCFPDKYDNFDGPPLPTAVDSFPLSVAVARRSHLITAGGGLLLSCADRVDVLELTTTERWKGRNSRTGKVGSFPSAHVRPLTVEEKEMDAADKETRRRMLMNRSKHETPPANPTTSTPGAADGVPPNPAQNSEQSAMPCTTAPGATTHDDVERPPEQRCDEETPLLHPTTSNARTQDRQCCAIL